MANWTADATIKLDALVALLDSTTAPSITFFGAPLAEAEAAIACETDIVIEPALRRGEATPDFPPKLGRSGDKTAIGKALIAAIEKGGDTASVVLITDGAEECGADFDAVRAKYPEAKFRVVQVGNSQNASLQRLEAEPRPDPNLQPSLALPNPLVVDVVSADAPQEATWDQRICWVLLVALSAIAAVLFCFQSGERTKILQDHLSQIESKTAEQLAAIYAPFKLRNGKKVRKKDHERFQIYWFRNRHHSFWLSYGTWALILSTLAAIGWAGLSFRELAFIALPYDLVVAVRRDSWTFLNSNIGAYSFAGTIIALVGFSALQWWQSLDTKKQLMLRSGIIATERAEVVRQQYDRARRSIQSIRLTRPSRYEYLLWSFEQIEIPGFDALQAKLIELAAPQFEDATEKRRREIHQFVNVRDPVSFANLLKLDDQISKEQVAMLADLLARAQADRLTDAAEMTAELLTQLSAASVDHQDDH